MNQLMFKLLFHKCLLWIKNRSISFFTQLLFTTGFLIMWRLKNNRLYQHARSKRQRSIWRYRGLSQPNTHSHSHPHSHYHSHLGALLGLHFSRFAYIGPWQETWTTWKYEKHSNFTQKRPGTFSSSARWLLAAKPNWENMYEIFRVPWPEWS